MSHIVIMHHWCFKLCQKGHKVPRFISDLPPCSSAAFSFSVFAMFYLFLQPHSSQFNTLHIYCSAFHEKTANSGLGVSLFLVNIFREWKTVPWCNIPLCLKPDPHDLHHVGPHSAGRGFAQRYKNLWIITVRATYSKQCSFGKNIVHFDCCVAFLVALVYIWPL